MKKTLIYTGILCVLVFLTFEKSLSFTFWKDDWMYLWNDLYLSKLLTPILLHPGTFIEIHLFNRLFGQNPFFWQVSGLVLKIVASLSVGVLSFTVTRSKKVSALSGTFYAISSSGLESTVWVSAHVTNILVICISLGISFLLEYINHTRLVTLSLSVIFLLAGLVADPVRVLPVVFIIVFIYFFLTPSSRRKRTKCITWSLTVTIVFLTAAYMYLLRNFLVVTPVKQFLVDNNNTVFGILRGVHVIGQYFNSLFNLMTNWFIPPQHYVNEASHGLYNRLFARIGAIIVSLLLTWCVLNWRKHKQSATYVLFFLLWMLLFYVPNWLIEPRLIAAGNHRYLTLPNAGYVCLIAYIFANIRSKYIAVPLCVVFIFGNVLTANNSLQALYGYRSERMITAVWNTISNQVSVDPGRKLFIFSGEEPANTNIFIISGAAPFALKRKIQNLRNFPIVSNDTAEIARFICSPYTSVFRVGSAVLPVTHLTIDNIYAWEIHNDGTVGNLSEHARQEIRTQLSTTCTPPV